MTYTTVFRSDFTAFEGCLLEIERLTAASPHLVEQIFFLLFDAVVGVDQSLRTFHVPVCSAAGTREHWVIAKPAKRLRGLVAALRATNGLLHLLGVGRRRAQA